VVLFGIIVDFFSEKVNEKQLSSKPQFATIKEYEGSMVPTGIQSGIRPVKEC